MKTTATLFALLAASPALAHDMGVVHDHGVLPFALGLCLIAAASAGGVLRRRALRVKA